MTTTQTPIDKLDSYLALSKSLDNEEKEKICIIEDISKLLDLLEYKPMSTQLFDTLMDASLGALEVVQHHLQVEYNTKEYWLRTLNK